MQNNQKDDPESQVLYDKALKYAKLYAKDCDDLTKDELSDAVFDHLTAGRKKFVPNVENVVKGAVQYVFRKFSTTAENDSAQDLPDHKDSGDQTKNVETNTGNKQPRVIKLPRRRGR